MPSLSKLDRLARNPVDGGSIIWAMKEHGVKILTPFQTYSQSEDNVVWMYLEFGMAQKYVDDLSATVKRGLRAKAESGWYPCPAPAGYMNEENTGGRNILVRDPERFDLIRKCWDLMLTGQHSPRQIREIANTAWGYKTVNGIPMSRNTIYQIFSNSFYYGVYEYPKGSGNWYTGRHIPMVSQAEFETVQKILSRSRPSRTDHKGFAFTGFIQCGACGSGVTAEEKKQLICSECRLKFAHISKKRCPRCGVEISKMKNPRRLSYIYYHCGKSCNPHCTERYMRGEVLAAKIGHLLESIKLSLAHDTWINRTFCRLSRSPQGTELLPIIRNLFIVGTTDTQHKIVSIIFSKMTLKCHELTVTLKTPFVFTTENQQPRPFDQDSLTDESVKKLVA